MTIQTKGREGIPTKYDAVQQLKAAQAALEATELLRDLAIVQAREAGVTQQRVAQLVGCSTDTIQRRFDSPWIRHKNLRHANKKGSNNG